MSRRFDRGPLPGTALGIGAGLSFDLARAAEPPRREAKAQPRERIVCVTAHPDDCAHSMGGTLFKLKDRFEIRVLCMSKGEKGIKGKTEAEAAAIRSVEETCADKQFGAEVTFLGHIDGELFPDRAICERVAELLGQLKPRAVFTLWPINVADHAAAWFVATKALRLAGAFSTTELYM